VVLKLTHMTAIDGTGIHAIESLAARIELSGRALIVCGAAAQPLQLIRRSKLPKAVGQQNLQPHLDAALERAAILHGGFDSPRVQVPA
jgi:sulfate permease, SulP family